MSDDHGRSAPEPGSEDADTDPGAEPDPGLRDPDAPGVGALDEVDGNDDLDLPEPNEPA